MRLAHRPIRHLVAGRADDAAETADGQGHQQCGIGQCAGRAADCVQGFRASAAVFCQLQSAGREQLVAAAVAAQVWGPSVGALLHGPLRVLAGPVAVSTLVTLAAVALVSILRSRIGSFPRTALVGTLAPVALVALLAARLG